MGRGGLSSKGTMLDVVVCKHAFDLCVFDYFVSVRYYKSGRSFGRGGISPPPDIEK